MLDSQVDEIKNRLDIIDVIGGYIRLQKAGRNYRGLCPFHNEKTPSFMVSPERQGWHCFGCNEGGDMFSFVMKIDGLEFGDALKILAQKAGVILKKQNPILRTKRQKLFEICQWATKFFETQLWKSTIGNKMLVYLKERALIDETIKEWHLGYAPDSWQSLLNYLATKNYTPQEILESGLAIEKENNFSINSRISKYHDRFRDRIMFPVCDINGQVVGFSGRINPFIKDAETAKYINTPQTLIYDKSRVLFGLSQAKTEIRKNSACILVEGNMDAIMSHQGGTKNSVASSGTALTDDHLKIIKRYTDNILFAFDTDSAGDTATKRGIDLALQNDFNVKIITLSEKDPADLIKISSEKWLIAVTNAQEIISFYFNNTLAKFSNIASYTAKEKKQIAQILLPVIKKVNNRIEQAHWLQELSKKISTDEKILWEQLKILKFSDNHSTVKIIDAVLPSLIELLEKRLTGLLLAWPQKTDFSQIDTTILIDQNYIKIIDALKNNQDIDKDLVNLKNDLLLQIDNEPLEEKNVAAEITFCFTRLRDLVKKDKLKEIEKQIKEAENQGDTKKSDNLIEIYQKNL